MLMHFLLTQLIFVLTEYRTSILSEKNNIRFALITEIHFWYIKIPRVKCHKLKTLQIIINENVFMYD